MIARFPALFALALALQCTSALYTGAFSSGNWLADDLSMDPLQQVSFVIALHLPHRREMHDTLMRVSTPGSPEYGQYLSLAELKQRFAPAQEVLRDVMQWVQHALPEARVEANQNGDMIMVTSSVHAVELGFNTRLQMHSHKFSERALRTVRATQAIEVPHQLHDAISFISLNTPITTNTPKSGRALRASQPRKGLQVDKGTVIAESGNEAVTLAFQATCKGGAANLDATPCSSSGDVPDIFVTLLDTENGFAPVSSTVPGSRVECFQNNGDHCDGTGLPINCTCMALVGHVQKYHKLQADLVGMFSDGSTLPYGTSNTFVVTDVATSKFLYDLYNIPYGIKVQHGADMAVAEFYGEFYSNSDLAKFFELSGMPTQQIKDEFVVGTLPNNQSDPGPEAQLDVEYIMALAPEADLWFYSMAELNPYSPINEGFLTWLWIIGNQTDPPLAHSLSYGDLEASVFNTSVDGAAEYGYRCDDEFMKMGLRGLSVFVASGDDGIGSMSVRHDPEGSCAVSQPEWPAGSPYITSVGATQLTDQFLPVCEKLYSSNDQLLPPPAQCTQLAETACSSAIGGVITTGGGFSNIYDRATYAPWQEDAVQKYLDIEGATPTKNEYFNRAGRAYPDVSAYGSNYFVYLDGQVNRESGTSASTPAFAAMVTLWNDMRLASGQPPLGFMNPWLYAALAKHPEAFYDITTGDNACGASHNIDDKNCCDDAYFAAASWDAVSGWGTPRFDVVANLLLNDNALFPSQGAVTYPENGICTCSDGDDAEHEGHHVLAGVAIGISIVGLLAAAFVFLKAPSSRAEQPSDYAAMKA